ncbi:MULTISPECIES: SAM-dependent methyltransferase [unclassified Exiguobacterium]|uniref:SAM-dependent methyltransferase n=1 Tax=unclassified Exiguobacterium TaxID=2644629 RepID=UPI000EEC2300|nr:MULTISPECIES: class I SAM-dependent methyltransferase [unclassified Exiguobacterium]MDX1258818.1 methyltransferase domain-containing protein [Exiguobacterium sp. K1]HCN56543.1 SAM-dependent methyltransferase [Exiguobacterium sp.]
MNETIRTHDDLLQMLDALLREPTAFWDGFYADRTKRIPFFVDKPDENLVRYVEQLEIPVNRVLELGSGPGRNALYLAEHGSQVDAVDLAKTSVDWANDRARERQLDVSFRQANLFDLSFEQGAYDFVYDSGCFHHIAPHRRNDYIRVVSDALRPGGCFALTCFVEGGQYGGSDITDWEVYRQRSLNGGLGFTEEKLRSIFDTFEVLDIRLMQEAAPTDSVFGLSGLWTALFRKN